MTVSAAQSVLANALPGDIRFAQALMDGTLSDSDRFIDYQSAPVKVQAMYRTIGAALEALGQAEFERNGGAD